MRLFSPVSYVRSTELLNRWNANVASSRYRLPERNYTRKQKIFLLGVLQNSACRSGTPWWKFSIISGVGVGRSNPQIFDTNRSRPLWVANPPFLHKSTVHFIIFFKQIVENRKKLDQLWAILLPADRVKSNTATNWTHSCVGLGRIRHFRVYGGLDWTENLFCWLNFYGQ